MPFDKAKAALSALREEGIQPGRETIAKTRLAREQYGNRTREFEEAWGAPTAPEQERADVSHAIAEIIARLGR